MNLTNPIHHVNDVASSIVAAREHTGSGNRQRHADLVLAAVRRHPGLTSGELESKVGAGLGLTEVRRRLTDLKDAGLIAMGPCRKCTVGAKPRLMATWAVAAEGPKRHQRALF